MNTNSTSLYTLCHLRTSVEFTTMYSIWLVFYILLILYSRKKTLVHAKEIQVCTKASSRFYYQVGPQNKTTTFTLHITGAPLVDATDGIAIGVLHGCIGKCCTEKYPSVFVNFADEAIWKFVFKNAGLPCSANALDFSSFPSSCLIKGQYVSYSYMIVVSIRAHIVHIPLLCTPLL